ncbi:MAG: TonB-dependent receptor plug domain-containing protein [Candidatus Sericytochromatia bacterium]
MKLLKTAIALSFLLSAQNAFAEEDTSLENEAAVLIKPTVSIASKSSLEIKKSPGVITLITEEEIKKSGARTIQEVLEKVPGIVFNVDVQGGVGISIRGLWGHEGKVLLLVDGQQLNDTLWSTTLFGNHITTNQIKRIEVLRGPGSSIYGGYAELAVINVITKKAEDLKGLSAKISAGATYNNPINSYTKRNLELSFGDKFGDLGVALHSTFGMGNTSDKVFTDFYSNSFDMLGNQNENPMYLNLNVQYKDFSALLISDLYRRKYVDGYSYTTKKDFGAIPINHDSYLAELKYDLKLGKSLTLTPKFNYMKYYPWFADDAKVKELNKDPNYSGVYFNRTSERYSADLTANYDINDNFNLLGGVNYYYDLGKSLDKDFADFGSDKKQDSVTYNTLAAFAQGLYKNDFMTFTLGSRYENNNAYGASFVPRASLVGFVGDFHTKLLYSKAFRSPNIMNLAKFYNTYSKKNNISPENTTVMELEAGYDITKDLSLSLNLFDINIQDPIIFFYDEKNKESYDNFQKTGTRGVEAEIKYSNRKNVSVDLSYSLYNQNENKVDVYSVPNNTSALLGAPMHKANLDASFSLTDHLSINPSLMFLGNRFAYGSVTKDDKGQDQFMIKEFSPVFLLNLNILYKDLLTKGLNLSLTGYNLLNQKDFYLQPYNGGHAPIERNSTEISLNLQYDFMMH